MEKEKMDIVKSVLRFLQEEIESTATDADQKESLEVAKQCIESSYEIDGNDSSIYSGAADLYVLFKIKTEITEESAKAAEELKIRGNTHMKQGQYSDALDLYTKAIHLNPKNHILYCNRAAAYSRLEKHWDAVKDCKESIKISPTAKAFGRLGVAYSSLNMYQEARDAYSKAYELDPTNNSYEQNKKLAEEYLQTQSHSGASASTSSGQEGAGPLNFGNFLNNPALLNMASQMISDPAFLNMVSGMMSSGPNGDPNIDGFLSVTQQLAQQMQATNPDLIDSIRQSMTGPQQSPNERGDADYNPDAENNQ